MIEAAEVMPVIRAAFGERADVTEYPIFHVLEVLSYMRDRGRDSVWTSRKFQKLTAPPLPVKR